MDATEYQLRVMIASLEERLEKTERDLERLQFRFHLVCKALRVSISDAEEEN